MMLCPSGALIANILHLGKSCGAGGDLGGRIELRHGDGRAAAGAVARRRSPASASGAAYFRSELMAALKIVDRGDIPADKLAGSWAGAFGQTRSCRRATCASPRRGRTAGATSSNSADDALASTAHYFLKSGWRTGAPGVSRSAAARLFRSVRPQGQGADVGLGGPRGDAHRRAAARRGRGGPAAAGRRGTVPPSWSRTISMWSFPTTRPNAIRSPACVLADRLAGGPGIVDALADRRSRIVAGRAARTADAARAARLRRRPARRGDRRKTKEAIADFQGKVGLPVNGHASQKVLACAAALETSGVGTRPVSLLKDGSG